MSRRSLSDRYARKLDHAVDELAGAPTVPLSPVHEQTLDVMVDLLGMARKFSGDSTPATLKTLMVMLERMRPTLVDSLRNVPPESIVEFMADLRDRMDSIVRKGGPGADTAEHELELDHEPRAAVVALDAGRRG